MAHFPLFLSVRMHVEACGNTQSGDMSRLSLFIVCFSLSFSYQCWFPAAAPDVQADGQLDRFCVVKMWAWNGASVFLPQTFVVCLFHFPHRLVLCCFMYVSLVVSSMWFLCLSASYLFVSSLALLLFSLLFSLLTSCYLSPSITPSLNLSLPLLPSLSLPISVSPSPFLSLSLSHSQHSQPLIIYQGFQGLPFPVIQWRILCTACLHTIRISMCLFTVDCVFVCRCVCCDSSPLSGILISCF